MGQEGQRATPLLSAMPGTLQRSASRSRSGRTTVAAPFPCLLGHDPGALVRWGQRQQREHVPGGKESRPPHGPADGLAAHQGAGARPRMLSCHLWGGGGRKCFGETWADP